MNNIIKEMKDILDNIDINNKPYLFLHVCCAPCASHILLKFKSYFKIRIIFYNPNIDTKNEFEKRLENLHIFLKKTELDRDIDCDIKIIYDEYESSVFLNSVIGLENEPERGERCLKCINLRLKNSLDIAIEYVKKNNLSGKIFFTSSLSTSPHKDANFIYKICKKICENTNITYLSSDFKKENGYLDSIKLCEKYGIYRQNYCGCKYAKLISSNNQDKKWKNDKKCKNVNKHLC